MNVAFSQRAIALWLMALLGCCSAKAQNQTSRLYGLTFFSNQLFAVDTNTGEGTLVGPLDATLSGYGIAARYGRLYTFDPNTDQIVEINPATAAPGNHINIGVTNLQGEGDLAFRGDGVGFLTSALRSDGSIANDLYTFDVIAGTSRRVATTPVAIDALAFDTNNTLYALGQDDVNLYTVDQITGATTLIGALGVAMSSPFAGLTFGPDGILYAAINDQLYVIDKTSGAAMAYGSDDSDFGFSSVSGLAFQTPQPPTHLVGISFFGNQLFSIDPATGAGSLIGDLGAATSAYGIATRSNTLYSFSPNNDQVISINPTTGRANGAIAFGLTGMQGEGDLAFRSDGTGFLVSALNADASVANALYALNVVGGTAQLIATTSATIDALAFDTNDVLYALAQDDVNLYQVNQTNGAITAVGPLGVALSSPFAGMTFGPDGTLYGALNDQLYTIDKYTGTASAVSTNVLDFGFSSVSGLAFAPSPAQLQLVREAGQPVLYWIGAGYTLESATSVTGPYVTASSQANPARLSVAAGAQMYFRLRR